MLALLVADVGEHLDGVLVVSGENVGIVLVDGLQLAHQILADGVGQLAVGQLARDFHDEGVRENCHNASLLNSQGQAMRRHRPSTRP